MEFIKKNITGIIIGLLIAAFSFNAYVLYTTKKSADEGLAKANAVIDFINKSQQAVQAKK